MGNVNNAISAIKSIEDKINYHLSQAQTLREKLDRVIAEIEQLNVEGASKDTGEAKNQPATQLQGFGLVPARVQEKTFKDRIMEALEKVQGEFLRRDLFNMVNNDGQGRPVEASYFGPFFSRLVKAGVIITVKESFGTKPGTYKKSDDSRHNL